MLVISDDAGMFFVLLFCCEVFFGNFAGFLGSCSGEEKEFRRFSSRGLEDHLHPKDTEKKTKSKLRLDV